MSRWARCNFDRKPIHPGDQRVIDEFKAFLRTQRMVMVNISDLNEEQLRIIAELQKELRGEKELATTKAEASLLLVAIASEIRSLHNRLRNLEREKES